MISKVISCSHSIILMLSLFYGKGVLLDSILLENIHENISILLIKINSINKN